MTTELKKQKLQEYIEQASEDDIDFLYQEVVEDAGNIEWSDEFTAEMESRVQEIENGNVKTISLEQALENARNAIQKVRERATVQH